MQETRVRSLSQEDPLEKEMATHSSILAWEIPWTEDPGGLLSMGSQRVIMYLFLKVIWWTEKPVDSSTWGSKESDMTE